MSPQFRWTHRHKRQHLNSSELVMTEVASWDESHISSTAAAAKPAASAGTAPSPSSTGGGPSRPQLAVLSQQPQPHQGSRDDAMVGYFSQRQGNEMGDGNGYQKQRWAVGDDSVIEQVRCFHLFCYNLCMYSKLPRLLFQSLKFKEPFSQRFSPADLQESKYISGK